ncbi:unnamed protein product [Thelazia callipaeda]|uniref:Grh/CP2 DB domain-containing protein n=1 Tax=Thelazia callipaeda TaxID=103827 RepID=A0A0N5D3Y1_THECL|nr:unnamed protein product [Thelazia callipaeda]
MLLSSSELFPETVHNREENESSMWQSLNVTASLPVNSCRTTTTTSAEYILMAPTSAAVPLHSEAVTFVNQNVSYEIKCRRCLVDSCSTDQDLFFKTVVTVCFDGNKSRDHVGQLTEIWKSKNPGKRFFEFDLPSCSNVSDVKYGLRSAEFVWDSSLLNATLYIKFFVLSSDFVESCGGKGEPFRLIFETYSRRSMEFLQQNSSLIQIFKACFLVIQILFMELAKISLFQLRGAERKRKIERKKAALHGQQEQFQPSYDYTYLLPTEFEFEADNKEKTDSISIKGLNNSILPLRRNSILCTSPDVDEIQRLVRKRSCSSTQLDNPSRDTSSIESESIETRVLPHHSPVFITKWLTFHRFNHYAQIFQNYNGEDILRLSIADLTSLIGDKPEGLRLFHSLRNKALEPQATIYIALDGNNEYEMIKLYSGTLDELKEQIQKMTCIKAKCVFIRGPRDIRVRVTDQVIGSWRNESIFRLLRNEDEYMFIKET